MGVVSNLWSFTGHLCQHSEVDKSLFPDSSNDTIIRAQQESKIKTLLKKNSVFQVLSFYRRNSFYIKDLIAKIKQDLPDVLLLQMDSNFLQIKKLKKLFPDILICTQINGSPFDEFYRNIAFRNWFIEKQREAYQISDLNFFISEFSRNRIMGEDVNLNRDKIIYNGTDIQKFYPLPGKEKIRKKLGYEDDEFIIGYIGTLDFHKKMIRLVEAFQKVQQLYPKTRLIIIGDGPAFSKIKSFVHKNHLEEKVQLNGWIKHDEVNEHLNSFDLAVHHYAHHYMNPLKVFEYLATGLPVIAPDIESIRKLFKNKEDLIISTQENENLHQEIINLIENTELREKLSSNSEVIKKIAENYTWKSYTEKILEAMKEKLNQF